MAKTIQNFIESLINKGDLITNRKHKIIKISFNGYCFYFYGDTFDEAKGNAYNTLDGLACITEWFEENVVSECETK